MSFDPYGNTPEPPRPPDPIRPADPTAPIDYPMPGPAPRSPNDAARDRVQLPGIFLLIIGLLNLLPGLFGGYQTATVWGTTAEDLHAGQVKQLKDNQEKMRKLPNEGFFKLIKEVTDKGLEQMEKVPPQELKNSTLMQYGGASLVVLLVALVQVLGGIRMLQLRSYVLCVIASLVSAIPCVSLSGCCCMGQAVGIWSLVVLLNSDVRSAFR
jgi:hypothetical protein